MFALISGIAFAAIFGGILLHHLLYPCGVEKRFAPGTLIRKIVHLFVLLFLEQSLNWGGRVRKLAFLAGLFSFVILLLTGFLPPLLGGRLEGWWLMLHATFAPVFIACAAAIVITGAQHYRFVRQDADQLAETVKQCKTRRLCPLTDCSAAPKVGFWLLAALSLPVTLTMVLSMTPLFGTEGQECLFELHRWSALAFALAAILTLYVLIRGEVRKDTENTTRHTFKEVQNVK